MAEYIDREALLLRIDCYGTNKFGMLDEDIRAFIKAQPAADVAPVRHGRWECGKPCPVCGRDRFEGLDADIWADWEPPYCPNCGAKMDETVEDDKR